MKEVQAKTQMINNTEEKRTNKDHRASDGTDKASQTTFSKSQLDNPTQPEPEKLKGLLDEDQTTQYPFFTEKAFMDMSLGKIPDFESIYQSLSKTQVPLGAPLTALQFMPALCAYKLTDQEEIDNFLNNPETNHVIVQNDLIKIVLIRWDPGAECNIHGHSEGGCVLKVLKGKIVEKRYSADSEKKLLSEGTYYEDNIAYIDDLMGLHSVANPFEEPAISLHMYTPGNYKPKKW